MKYGVFDNNKPASKVGYPSLKDEGWNNHIFDTLENARAYAKEWLGVYGEDAVLKVNVPFDYSHYGDMIEIRELTE